MLRDPIRDCEAVRESLHGVGRRHEFMRQQLLAFYGLALLLSWSYWGFLLAQGVIVGAGTWPSHLPGLLGPGLAAAILIGVTDGRSALRGWLLRLWWPVRVGWAGVMWALSPLVAAGLVYGGWLLMPDAPVLAWRRWSEYPGMPRDWPIWAVVFTAWVLNGCGEEAGWRALAFDRLEQTLGAWSASWVVGCLWLFWHLPLFFLTENFRALWGWPVLGWGFSLICGSFALGAIYLRGGRSGWVVAIWHFLFNGVVATPLGQGLPAMLMSGVVMILGIVVAVRQWRGSPGLP